VERNEEYRIPDHIVKTVQSLYINTRIKNDKGTSVSNKEIHINQGVKQGCHNII
jgi:hypothetical protein